MEYLSFIGFVSVIILIGIIIYHCVSMYETIMEINNKLDDIDKNVKDIIDWCNAPDVEDKDSLNK